MREIKLLGYGSGNGASHAGCGDAPEYLQKSSTLATIIPPYVTWGPIFNDQDPSIGRSHLPTITWLSQHLAAAVQATLAENKFFITLGGDHSSGIGTWSGAAEHYRPIGDIGLIWLDAHLDAHTFETTPSGNIHGMPVACLLGHGHNDLTSIISPTPKIKPQNLVYIGARSYEEGEHNLLKKLGVKIYYMEEVKARGLLPIFTEALRLIKKYTIAYGISFDLDCLDPEEAPAVGNPVKDGMSADEMISCIQLLANDTKFIGAEIVEFNPHLDVQQKTERITINLLNTLFRIVA